jgi:hypothetical protein
MCYGDMCRRLLVHTWWPEHVVRNLLTFFDRIWTEGVKGKATKALRHLQKPMEHLAIIGLGFYLLERKKKLLFFLQHCSSYISGCMCGI